MTRTILFSLACLPALAFAHPGHDQSATFFSGFAHPLLGWDHLAAAIAVGLLAAATRGLSSWVLPTTFVVAMMSAFVVSTASAPLAMMEFAIAASLMCLGLLAIAGRDIPRVACVIVAVFGGLHGFVHGSEMPAGNGWFMYACGLALATTLSHAIGLLVGKHATTQKISSGVIAALGLVLLGSRVV